MPAQPPTVTVVIVNYNGGQYLAESLAALQADPTRLPFDVLVVDNASFDGSRTLAESLAAGWPRLRVLTSPTNRGYAGGVNFALPHARGAYLAVLNMDMLVSPGWLEPLVDFLEAHPETGAVNPLILLRGDGPETINAAGQEVHVTGLGFNRLLGQPRARAGSQPTRVSGLQGGALLIRRAVLESLGGWDESGFLYHEDVALSWLLQLAGHDLYCVPASVVRHTYHLTMYPEKLFLLERNRLALLLTHLEPPSLLRLLPLLLITEAMLWGYTLLRGPAFLRAKFASYVWLLRQCAWLRERRAAVRRLRRRPDRELLQRLRWNYRWDQFFTLGRERGASRREPVGGLPVELP